MRRERTAALEAAARRTLSDNRYRCLLAGGHPAVGKDDLTGYEVCRGSSKVHREAGDVDRLGNPAKGYSLDERIIETGVVEVTRNEVRSGESGPPAS